MYGVFGAYGEFPMKAAERQLVDKNLDLIFEFEKYVLEHPEFAKKIPRHAVVMPPLHSRIETLDLEYAA